MLRVHWQDTPLHGCWGRLLHLAGHQQSLRLPASVSDSFGPLSVFPMSVSVVFLLFRTLVGVCCVCVSLVFCFSPLFMFPPAFCFSVSALVRVTMSVSLFLCFSGSSLVPATVPLRINMPGVVSSAYCERQPYSCLRSSMRRCLRPGSRLQAFAVGCASMGRCGSRC